MTPAEYGYLLLCCDTGSGERPLTDAQVRQLRLRVRASQRPLDDQRDVCEHDLTALGYDAPQAQRIVRLLERREQLDAYLSLGRARGYYPLCRRSERFPVALSKKLGDLCPAVLFYAGELSLLDTQCVSLVGSRRLSPSGAAFAARVGRLAAQEQLTLVSGGAVGADSTAARACRAGGGSVIVFPADALSEYTPRENIVYLAQGGWHLPFTGTRALTRNRFIHAQGEKVLVAQASCGTGGTWRGTAENLQHGWSDVFVHDDGSEAAQALVRLGARPVPAAFESLRALSDAQQCF